MIITPRSLTQTVPQTLTKPHTCLISVSTALYYLLIVLNIPKLYNFDLNIKPLRGRGQVTTNVDGSNEEEGNQWSLMFSVGELLDQSLSLGHPCRVTVQARDEKVKR